MAIRDIIYLGDERLTIPSKPVTQFGAELQTLIDDMFETMYFTNGVGLAAPQLGINIQLTTIDVTEDKSEQWCLVNPQIIFGENEIWMTEGCLSIPGAYEEVLRPEKITFKALDRYGKPLLDRNGNTEITADGLFARCIQHENDHLQGKLFIRYLSELKRQRAIEQYRKTMRSREKS